MRLPEKLEYLQENHLGEWLEMRRKVNDELSDRQGMWCVCKRLATGFHESACRKFKNKVTNETIKRLKHLLPKKPLPAKGTAFSGFGMPDDGQNYSV